MIAMYSRGLLCLLLLSVMVGCDQSAVSNEPEATTETAGTANDQPSGETTKPCCTESKDDAKPIVIESGGVSIPDVALINQDGETVRLLSDLAKGKIVALNFIFTTCKGICPPMSANFAALQRKLGDRFGDDVVLVSVTVDPTVDTPARLQAWREQFGGQPGWTLLTGEKRDVDYVLKELEVFTADKNDHSPFILLGDEAAGNWQRVHGLTSPEKLAEIIQNLHEQSQAAREPSPAKNWFTDVELVNQNGQPMRFYSDLLRGKVVVINSFFSTCKGACPVMLATFAKIQQRYEDRLGKDLVLISVSVDPEHDTPETLAAYAEQWQAKPGWFFITGEKANVDTALFKLGQYTENKEGHSNVFIIGNETTGLWKKVRGLSKPESIFPLIDEVLQDKLPDDRPIGAD